MENNIAELVPYPGGIVVEIPAQDQDVMTSQLMWFRIGSNIPSTAIPIVIQYQPDYCPWRTIWLYRGHRHDEIQIFDLLREIENAFKQQ